MVLELPTTQDGAKLSQGQMPNKRSNFDMDKRKGRKVVFVLLDGLAYPVARQCCGYLQALVDVGKGQCYELTSELPSLSRPLYECLLSGVKPINSGIISNNVRRTSRCESVFSIAVSQGRTTAASAYYWISELYNHAPWDDIQDRYVVDPKRNINYGIFYNLDTYPDELVINDGEILRQRYDPNFLMIHPMGIDYAGHQHGVSSSEYRNAVRNVDTLLSRWLEIWLREGYQVVITSDHGMSDDCSHGGTSKIERQVPLWVFGSAFSLDPNIELKQLEVSGVLCQLLGLQHYKALNFELFDPDFVISLI